jgi:predicted phage baseplate assembly protein
LEIARLDNDLNAPEAFRTQERAVTEEDYAEVAERHAEIQKAVATRRWTGSWHTMFLTVDRTGGGKVDEAFEEEVRAHLEKYRLAGHDVEVDSSRTVSLDIAVTVCVDTGYFRSDVKRVLLEEFSNRDLVDGQQGFFHPDGLTFGQPVYLSQVIARTMDVDGVLWVDIDTDDDKPHRFKRWGEPQRDEVDEGLIAMDRLEIARLDNDLNAPENGKIEFFLEGGM